MNKKESALASMPKLIISVTLIVMLGALFGAVEYLVTHRVQTNIPTANLPIKSEVVVSTDKTEYEQKDSVEITVTNNLKQSIFSIATSSTPEFSIKNIEKQKSDGMWEKLSVRCNWPECDIDFDGPAEIKSGESEKFSWKLAIYINGKNVDVEQGLYRLNLEYQIKDKEWKTVYSNEFTIKEKQSGVSITTDKTEYEIGEKINATLNYTGKIYQWDKYALSIQKFENNKWVDIQRKGDPYFLCANIPDCKDVNLGEVEECLSTVFCEMPMWYEIKDMPKLVWDQSYKVEEKAFSCNFIQRYTETKEVISSKLENRSCAIFTEAKPGKYKIRFEYATDINREDNFNRKIDIKYTEKEFAIKEKSALISDDVCKEICGDGVCNEIVCMAVGCPCPETAETCPDDCK